MKKVIFVLGYFVCATAFASEIKITSFRYLNGDPAYRSPVAELCGHLVDATGRHEVVKIVVDPDSKGPGYYFTTAGKDGNFCQIVATFTGRALASHDSEN